jgi:DNA-binding YbaB/EbfC family protein
MERPAGEDNMAKSFGPMNHLVKQAQQMQKKMAELQEELGQKTCSASSGGGMVAVEANGHHQITSIVIQKEVVNPEDVEMLQDLILTAANDALKRAQDMVADEMKKITGGLNIPGMF